MSAPTIDLNADLGEGSGHWAATTDEALLAIVSSANVACGGHAGAPEHLRQVCRVAADRGVAIGAHVSYPDREGFGRRALDIAPHDLEASVGDQLALLRTFAHEAGSDVRYVKPHGALYNAIGSHEAHARAVVSAVAHSAPRVAVLGLPGARWLEIAADAGLRPVHEAFADRAYRADGTLVARDEVGAVLHDPDVIAARVLRLVTEGTVDAVDGTSVRLRAQSVCVHGDTPGAVAIAAAVRRSLVAAGLAIASFT